MVQIQVLCKDVFASYFGLNNVCLFEFQEQIESFSCQVKELPRLGEVDMCTLNFQCLMAVLAKSQNLNDFGRIVNNNQQVKML